MVPRRAQAEQILGEEPYSEGIFTVGGMRVTDFVFFRYRKARLTLYFEKQTGRLSMVLQDGV